MYSLKKTIFKVDNKAYWYKSVKDPIELIAYKYYDYVELLKMNKKLKTITVKK